MQEPSPAELVDPVADYFDSMAERDRGSLGPKAVAVVFSGTGGDGTSGARDVEGPDVPTPPASGSPIFDAHLHVVDVRFPLKPNRGYLPEPFTPADYRARVAGLGVVGGAVVSGSFHGFDQTHLEAALTDLGPGFVGVAQLPPDVSDAEILRLDALGVRGVRFNLRRGIAHSTAEVERLGRRVHDAAGWHTELYADAADLADALDALGALPKLSIDHLGLTAAGLPTVLRLVDRGARVKATGFGRVDFDVADALRRIAAVNPAAPMFGTDLPCTRAPRPFRAADVALVREALGEQGARLALHDNAAGFYLRPSDAGSRV
ncbi:MAG: amidohydrolase family protein [Myxococcota bacterium]